MIYRKPDIYDTFSCMADACPASCCEGWQIVIDDDSLEKYMHFATEELPSQAEFPSDADRKHFQSRIAASVDWQEGVFRQSKGRCAFLNDMGLCDLQCHLGEQALCSTCSQYPRHTEEFYGVRE